MGWSFPNNVGLHKVTMLFLLIFLPLFSAIRNLKVDSGKSGLMANIDASTDMSQFQGTIPHFSKNVRVDLGTNFARNDDSDTWSSNCELCNIVYIRAVGGEALPVAPPEKPSSEKKPNVGAVVGFTFLLVFILVAGFVCIYRNRRSTSQVTARQQVVMQPGIPRVENPPQGQQQVEMLQGQNQNEGDRKDRKDDKKQGEKIVEGLKGNGDDQKGKKRPQDEVVGQRERVKDGNEGKELPHREKVVAEPKRREGKQQEEAPRDEGAPKQKRRGVEGKQQEEAPRDEGVAKQRRRGAEGKQPEEAPRDEGVAKQRRRGVEGKQAEEAPRDEGVAKQRRRGAEEKQQEEAPRDEGIAKHRRRGAEGKQKAEPPQDKGVAKQRRRGVEEKQQEEAPRDEGITKHRRRGAEGKQQAKPPQDEGIAKQRRGGVEGKQQEEAPRDEGIAKQRRREGKQQAEPPLDEGIAKQKKRGREGKQQQPLEEDVGRQYKRGKEEKRNGKGVEAKEEPQKEEIGRQRAKHRDGKQPDVMERANSLGLPNKYSLECLLTATNKFNSDNNIGKGGFGNVYLGILPDGTKVAVKVLKIEGKINDFKNEVDALAKANHPNIVKLIGYCAENLVRILVYEYMINGSLSKWIFHETPEYFLTWPEMKNIIQGIAQGLVYIHEDSEKTILHRDLKPHNIVLDENKNAKLCDFGIAKLMDKDQSSTSTAWAGTPGYMAPEVLKQNKISDKVDVYSFGIVVLEVIFGKRYKRLVTCNRITNTEEIKLLDLIKNLSEEMQKEGKEIEKFGKIAMWCIRERPEERPIMLVALGAIESVIARASRRN